MIEGDDAVTIVDTMESLEAAERIAVRFRAITDKPVRAIIYTHSHPDHIHGAPAFINNGDPVEIYAHHSLEKAVDQTVSVLQPIITQRSFRMYGSRLPDANRTNVGIGPFVDLQEHSTLQILRPTKTFQDELSITVGGVEMILKHAPGETDDQVVVWLPKQKVLLPGNNFYRAFPNLYTIRGTSYRDPKTWADSLEMMRDLEPEYLVPGHSRPVTGKAEIRKHLTDYRDAIRYVYNQTIRMMNAGKTPDDIAHEIRLPPRLAQSPFLQEFYGKPEWSARMVFGGTLGWFDGNPSNLHPTPPREKAERMAQLAGNITLPLMAVTPNDTMLEGIPIRAFFDGMSVNLEGDAAWDIYQSVVFEFPDLEQSFTLTVRGGASELRKGASEDASIHVRIDSLDFKRMLAGIRNPALAILSDFEYVQGGRIGFTRFIQLFEPNLET